MWYSLAMRGCGDMTCVPLQIFTPDYLTTNAMFEIMRNDGRRVLSCGLCQSFGVCLALASGISQGVEGRERK